MTDARATYLTASVATAPPERLLVMLCDRLHRDLAQALDAQRAGQHAAAHVDLLHAQEIVLELRGSLQVEVWEGGPGLASLYDFLHLQLVRANVSRDPGTTESCLGLVRDLAETWRQAALQVAGQHAVQHAVQHEAGTPRSGAVREAVLSR